MINSEKIKSRFDWVDGLKAFAIIGILLNHFVEEFGEGPWFSNPSYNWPSFSDKIATILPNGSNWLVIGMKFLGWLADMGPGVFILLSGFTLALSQLRNEKSTIDFYRSRAIRIFPLYIAIHLIVLIFAVVANYPAGLKVFSPQVFLSLLGLRFSDSLFFFINPSWWFIWLIIQLYLFFPFLFKLLKSKNLALFIGITLLITILSRVAGLYHLTYSNNLYFWMTGLFAGTRLFEFTIGMALAKLLISKPDLIKWFSAKPLSLLLVFILVYLVGFLSSWSYIGSLVSNILITIGLSGIFYGFYSFISRKNSIKKGILFIGRNSFSVFLLHQTFMMYASDKLDGIPKVLVLIAIVVISFPVGYLIERAVNFVIEKITLNYMKIEKIMISQVSIFLIYLLIVILIVVNVVYTLLPIDLSKYNKILTAVSLAMLSAYLIMYFNKFKRIHPAEFLLFFITIIVFHAILPPDWVRLISVALFMEIILFHGFKFILRPLFSLLISSILVVFIFTAAEHYFRSNKPLEVGQWGEFPALRTDSITTYSLIPNKTTHLKYNNYDYVVRTNSLGFNSPEIDLQKKDSNIFRVFIVGDAFSMPEGMEYQNSYPFILEQELRKTIKGRVIQVINGGVTGYGPNEELAQIKYFIAKLKPDLIINEFFINEFQEINLTPQERLNDIGFNTKMSQKLKYFGYSQVYRHYYYWLGDLFGVKDAQYKYNKSLLYLYEKSSAFYSDTVINKIDSYLKDIKELADKNGSKLILMFVPGQIEVSSARDISYYPNSVNLADTSRFDFDFSNKIINSLCKKHLIDLYDTEELLRTNPDQPVYFEESWHWNLNGHKLIGYTLATNIKYMLENEYK